MNDYTAVQKALEGGAEPAMLCATCPWDRTCISPPMMTSAEIDALIEKAAREDETRSEAAVLAGKAPPMPAGVLMATVVYAGKDMQANVCPVFALRLRSSGGREIANGLRASMQGWDDSR